MAKGPRRIQKGIGKTGRFGEFFILLGSLHFLYGVGMVLSPLLGFPMWPLTGNEPVVDGIQAGMLWLLLGAGFVGFGIVAIRSGWARHHSDADM